jgi:hypothetical protein
MTVLSLGKDVVSLLSDPLSSSTPQVRDPKVMKLLIMPQSLSLCLTGYAWFGQASSRSLLKWSVGGLARTLVTTRVGRYTSHTRAAHLLVIDIIAVSHSCGPLKALLAPLFATFDALLGAVGDDIG